MTDETMKGACPTCEPIGELIVELENKLTEKDKKLEIALEGLESIACAHVKLESIKNWKFKDAKEVILNDTKIARKALEKINQKQKDK